MKKNISESLSNSLQQERDHINKFNFSKFDIADQVLRTVSAKKTKTIRDTFTLPEDDYIIIDFCKKRLLKEGISATKSEIIRMGLKVLQEMSKNEIKSSYNLITKIKVGRPKNI